ncbi:MAG TPA: bifunctional demethylmenaquinone methyltransferase/2-methoxy-6-polyprenyl-1,4-benzoquinol methylase UbiE [Vicinamibacterales bacterium]|jgi:demethylmenaquinone methyltransferase/2-methoxy-6-polyprenyl-1,4-benzoquinol methylase
MATAPDKSPDRIARMFDAIAPRYDLLNHLLSAGIDRRWRTAAIRSLKLTGRERLLDVCCGTADVALESRRGRPSLSADLSAEARSAKVEARSAKAEGPRAARVVGVDFSGAMLALGLQKVRAAGEAGHVTLLRGDAMHLPAADQSVDAATVAFGIRNVQRPDVACREIARVLRPGGRLAILEFGVPRIPGIKPVYLWYFTHVLPRIGRAISGHHAAYSYLPASVGTFAPPSEFVETLRSAGFSDVRADPLTFGIVYLYTARRAAA